MSKIFAFMSIFIIVLSMTACNSKNTITNPYTQEYVAGQGNIQGNVNVEYFIERDIRFDIGADKDGVAVFKNPEEAYQALLENCSSGIALIKKEFALSDISQKNYNEYKAYGWQVSTGSEEERKEANFVSGFFDIYENSFS